MIDIPSRQVHLDFHTSEYIPEVGAKFDKEQFQQALRFGHLNSITIFAKCHHSWSYYPTKVGRSHPHLKTDLLGQQIEACHEIGIRAPIYYTVGWSANDAEDHPEWHHKNKDGSTFELFPDPKAKPSDPKPTFSWKYLCPSGSYREHMYEQTKEIVDMYPVDGFFYDICCAELCYCDRCKSGMKDAGLDWEKEEDAKKWYVQNWREFMQGCNEIILAKYPEATIFYNGSAEVYRDQFVDLETHMELEDLPTTWGGYEKFPVRSKYFANYGKQLLAMSGKFHTAWGEFGGFKHPEAIRYEGAAMIAWGSGCSFGDQLHPSGEADLETYRNIGEAYKYVEQIEEYGLKSGPYSNLGIWLSGDKPSDQGVATMLHEVQMDYELVDKTKNIDKYETIIIPGGNCLNSDEAALLSDYAKKGGSLIIIGESALDKEKKKFLFDFGATYEGPGTYDIDYLFVKKKIGEDVVTSPFLCYSPALKCIPEEAEILGGVYEPYFSRTYEKYCSHQYTCYQTEPAKHPGIIKKGSIIYFAHHIGAIYYEHGARIHRQVFINALSLLYKKPVLKVDMPSAAKVNFLVQPAHKRYVAHLLYAPPIQRGRCLVIEDMVPLYYIPVEVTVPEKIKNVYLAPQKEKVDFEIKGETVFVTVPKVECHQAIVFEY
ncbi:MAG: hypothetical protein GF401_03140 [Chitinivibrionales bacterium]|nr:hypothetical protein [Chitinivibrionales bacterium]